MAALKEMPFGRYYGSVDATPLFVLLAGAYYERTGDRAFVESLWPNVEAALRLDRPLRRSRRRRLRRVPPAVAPTGSSIRGGRTRTTPSSTPTARRPRARSRCARSRATSTRPGEPARALAAVLGHAERAAQLTRQAEELRERFEQAFWCEELSTYALALDGDKRPCRVRTSNAGHCLFTGIAGPERARRVARTLLGAESFSGWGVRTRRRCARAATTRWATTTARVWPHDNALIAHGLARYGLAEEALQIWTGLFEAAHALRPAPDAGAVLRLPAGARRGAGPRTPSPARRRPGRRPPCSSSFRRAWVWRSTAPRRESASPGRTCRPSLGELRIHNLEVAGATVDLLLVRHEHDVGVNVLRRDGDVQILVVK